MAGHVFAVWLVMRHGVLGMALAFPTLAIAWMTADRADPSKWSRRSGEVHRDLLER